jgi:hypothetical protein
MGVHFWGPLHTTLAAVPAMRDNGGGRIVNVSSIGGKIGVPHLASYCASKFALTGFSEAVRAELAKDAIYVTTVLPGLMRTGSPFNAWFKGRHRDEFTWFAISDSMPVATIDGRRAALQLIDACRHGDAELVITWPAKMAIIANALVPEIVALAMNVANALVLPQPAKKAAWSGTAAGRASRTGLRRSSRNCRSRRQPATTRSLSDMAIAERADCRIAAIPFLQSVLPAIGPFCNPAMKRCPYTAAHVRQPRWPSENRHVLELRRGRHRDFHRVGHLSVARGRRAAGFGPEADARGVGDRGRDYPLRRAVAV